MLFSTLCLSSFTIILMGKIELVLPYFNYHYLLMSCDRQYLWLFFTVPWVGLRCECVIIPDHTHLLFGDNKNLS